ncbi:MAG: aldo/keto reductase [Chthonomonas sp.]|nr:aldo/keto reductase [Chthonomonas sp.]
MEFRSLGRTGVQVSVACMGTMTFGWEPDDWGSHEDDCYKIVDKAISLGINFFDTADVYARGTSEKILGKAIKGKRDDLIIATKCHGKMSDTDPNMWGNSRRHVIQACEDSLKRLKTDWIDLYQIHRPQPSIPIDETLRGLEDLVRAGKIRYAGCSTFAAWQVTEAHYVARHLGLSGFVSEQPPLNLLDRRAERELLPFCRTYEYAVIPWSPLAGGQLSGKYLDGAKGARYSKSDPMKRLSGASREAIARYKKIADRYEITMTELALGWVASRPGVTSPIIGARSEQQLEQAVKGCLTKLSPKAEEQIDRVLRPGEFITDYYNANFGPNARPSI